MIMRNAAEPSLSGVAGIKCFKVTRVSKVNVDVCVVSISRLNTNNLRSQNWSVSCLFLDHLTSRWGRSGWSTHSRPKQKWKPEVSTQPREKPTTLPFVLGSAEVTEVSARRGAPWTSLQEVERLSPASAKDVFWDGWNWAEQTKPRNWARMCYSNNTSLKII